MFIIKTNYFKSRRCLFPLLLFFAVVSSPIRDIRAQNFSHIKTGGFDYAVDMMQSNPDGARWLATHHDMIVGLGNWSSKKLPESIYDNMKSANPDVLFIQYIPYNTVMNLTGGFDTKGWLENWCDNNGRNKDDLFYHYAVPTTVRLRNQNMRSYPAGAIVPSVWHSGNYPNINPTSQTFRDAFNAYALEVCTINASANKYCDGIFLDTFDGTTSTNYDIHLENSVEMRALGLSDPTSARAKVKQDILDARNELEVFLSQRIGKTIRAIPNAADINYAFDKYADIFAGALAGQYDEIGIEYLITSRFTDWTRVERLKQLYDSLEKGNFYFINSQTNYNDRAIPARFTQFILATHYLVNHSNAYFSYHVGGAGNYNGRNGSLSETHWHKNIEYDIGRPVQHVGGDYWGANNTDKFFLASEGSNYKLLGREYQNALVLAKFGNVGGWNNIGANPSSYNLGGSYRLLQPDNTLGPVINSIALGFGEGAILIKETSGGTPAPTNQPTPTPQPTITSSPTPQPTVTPTPTPQPTVTPTPTPQPTTTPGRKYNINNFIQLIQNWLQTGNEQSDVNNDNIVNTRDLGIMMSNWE